MLRSALLVAASMVLGPLATGDPAGPSSATAAPTVGVSEQPCRGVPTQPTAAHNASADPYQSWMREWLSLDWGQLCRYQAANARLPPATAVRVVFLGDSITDNWINLDPDLFRTDRLDRGISSQTTGQMLLRFRADVLELHPAIVHILAGTNDIAGNTGSTSLA
ncbi:MAG: GDSL family lipase, partial [Gammaproteobacteria bacterium]|nr:GDSL family lipase [Gammaproteobacteria bacterium]